MNNTPIHTEQRCLAMLCLYDGKIDGIAGPKTDAARLEFAEREQTQADDAYLLQRLYDKISTLPVDQYRKPDDLAVTVKALCQAVYVDKPAYWAYIMATVQHETANTYYPVPEAFYIKSDSQRERTLKAYPYYPFYGRGLVQLTWEFNYLKYSNILGMDLVAEPDLALEPGISLFILVHGMLLGTYTGRRLSDYLEHTPPDFQQARRVVNGMDKADLIAGYAEHWLTRYQQGNRP